MLTISRDKVYDRLDKNIPPSAICESGETVIFETRDCYDDSVTSEERPLGDREDALVNPATGPLYINGADAGDVLKVEILDISLHSRGVMCASFSWGIFAGRLPEAKAVMYEIEGDKIRFDDMLLLDCCPMIGVIGTAPVGEGIATSVPGVHGGNMDCRKIGAGTVLYLPVAVPGALLSMGDLHALMGDREVFGCGLEIAGTVTVRVSVLKEIPIPTPFLITRDAVITIRSAATVFEAGKTAVRLMEEFVRRVTGLEEVKSEMLMSLVSHMSVCQIVDPLMTARVEFPRNILERYGWRAE
ncbi:MULTISPECIES: acetamidase/formamidase family protein [Eisenbergiella]|uniref:acetamidase/formamidase family protein n=1 Tax=Eisenbergiella TaxID=1432051 RepID=UPI0023EF7793|nr:MULTISPECIES: acetamidase/formamidase family protein [Eisenbergiella]MCI6708280.1 acetamidase/formamidase family protein [Eisenbergiella massiliensis]MDY5525340.1 acetamidase/formamidase family protein [Eisenbergiella porci]